MPPGFEWIFIVTYVFGAVFLHALIVLNVLAARGLPERRRRALCIVAAAVNCLQVPFGSVLGVLTLIVLTKPGVRDAFD